MLCPIKLPKCNMPKYLKRKTIKEFIQRNFKKMFKRKIHSKVKQKRKLVKKSMIYLLVNKYQMKIGKIMYNF